MAPLTVSIQMQASLNVELLTYNEKQIGYAFVGVWVLWLHNEVKYQCIAT